MRASIQVITLKDKTPSKIDFLAAFSFYKNTIPPGFVLAHGFFYNPIRYHFNDNNRFTDNFLYLNENSNGNTKVTIMVQIT